MSPAVSRRAQTNIFMRHGSGLISPLFSFLIECVAAEIHGCGSGSAGAPPLVTYGAGSDGTDQCAERRRERVGRSQAQDCIAGPSAPPRRKTYGVGRPGGGYSCSWEETIQVGTQREGVVKLELRDEGLRGSHRPAARDQYGRVEQSRH